mmetsp:Transcript_38770/g.109628  ORF Transcript_38770/g.109628 Transcript_38770/m.109628 type:complete len:131 (+) Transcript_38770:883-1275(+)
MDSHSDRDMDSNDYSNQPHNSNNSIVHGDAHKYSDDVRHEHDDIHNCHKDRSNNGNTSDTNKCDNNDINDNGNANSNDVNCDSYSRDYNDDCHTHFFYHIVHINAVVHHVDIHEDFVQNVDHVHDHVIHN